MSLTPSSQSAKASAYPVKGLTKAQRETFEAIACGQDFPYRPKTISLLLKKKAIVQTGEKIICQDAFGIVKVPVFEVPMPLHLAWCQWCAENYSESEE